jgi:3-hydroxybutyrate dehydrogenase
MTLSPTDHPADTVGVDLSGRSARDTGAGSGIGRASGLRLARAGAHVLTLDLDAEAVRDVAAATGGRAVVADLSDLAALDDLELKADIVVNCAGIQQVTPVHEFPPEKFSLILRIMLEAPFRIIRQTLPGMYAAGWGRVINISSVHGLRASEFKSAYVTAKHGLEGLSKVVALEGAPHGVTSNCVNPGYVRTPLVDRQIADQARTHGITEAEVLDSVLLAKAALKRLVEPEEVAEMVAFLCSPPAASMTGTSLVMDGGWSAR